MRLWTDTGLYYKGGAGGLLLDTGSMTSFLPLPALILDQISTANVDPGVTTLRLPDSPTSRSAFTDLPIKEVDVEVCFVCKKCRVAFAGESSLLQHQRQCFGGNLEARGAFRIVQAAFECKLCETGEKHNTFAEFKRHCEGLEGHFRFAKVGGSTLPPPSESPLSHEMEDVVNQITLIAARTAQQTVPDQNSNNFCQPAEPKRRFMAQNEGLSLTSAGH